MHLYSSILLAAALFLPNALSSQAPDTPARGGGGISSVQRSICIPDVADVCLWGLWRVSSTEPALIVHANTPAAYKICRKSRPHHSGMERDVPIGIRVDDKLLTAKSSQQPLLLDHYSCAHIVGSKIELLVTASTESKFRFEGLYRRLPAESTDMAEIFQSTYIWTAAHMPDSNDEVLLYHSEEDQQLVRVCRFPPIPIHSGSERNPLSPRPPPIEVHPYRLSYRQGGRTLSADLDQASCMDLQTALVHTRAKSPWVPGKGTESDAAWGVVVIGRD